VCSLRGSKGELTRKACFQVDRQPRGERAARRLRSAWSGWRASRYRSSVEEGLEDAFTSCGWEEDFVLGEDRLIIFSDHHKGKRDGADDFWVAERAYYALQRERGTCR